jgi:hypothetical protein
LTTHPPPTHPLMNKRHPINRPTVAPRLGIARSFAQLLKWARLRASRHRGAPLHR